MGPHHQDTVRDGFNKRLIKIPIMKLKILEIRADIESIGWLGIVIFVLNMSIVLYIAFSSVNNADFYTNLSGFGIRDLSGLIIFVVCGLSSVMVNTLLILGSLMEFRFFLIPWLVTVPMVLSLILCMIVVKLIYGDTYTMFDYQMSKAGLFISGVYAYFWQHVSDGYDNMEGDTENVYERFTDLFLHPTHSLKLNQKVLKRHNVI